jgi:5-formyltetrahydrofolate cyclo-ligase
MTIREHKAALREAAAARRKAAHDAAHGAAEAARDNFLASGLHRDLGSGGLGSGGLGSGGGEAPVASAYCRIRSEIDPMPLMLALLEAGFRLCVPVIDGRDLPLRFREWTPATRLEPGLFGARVPTAGDWLEPELLIVPLLAFDAAGRRLGYGGGYYDRTLARLRGRPGMVRAVGIAYAAQEMQAVPADETDQRLDAIVTEAGVVRPGGRLA